MVARGNVPGGQHPGGNVLHPDRTASRAPSRRRQPSRRLTPVWVLCGADYTVLNRQDATTVVRGVHPASAPCNDAMTVTARLPPSRNMTWTVRRPARSLASPCHATGSCIRHLLHREKVTHTGSNESFHKWTLAQYARAMAP